MRVKLLIFGILAVSDCFGQNDNPVGKRRKLQKIEIIDSCAAVVDIRNGKAKLYGGGGFVVQALSTKDHAFQKSYDVMYVLYGCTIPEREKVGSYNMVVAEHLDKLYGNQWRKDVRPDIINVTK